MFQPDFTSDHSTCCHPRHEGDVFELAMAGHLASKLGGSYPRYGFLVFIRDSTHFDFVKISLGRRTEDFTSHALELLHDGVAHPSNIQRDARCDSCALKTLCTVAA